MYPPLIKPTGTQPDYQVSMTCWRMQMCPGQMYPHANQSYWYRAQLHQVSITCWRAVWPYIHCNRNHTYSDIGWSVFCSCYKTPLPCKSQRADNPLRHTYHRSTTGKWHKSLMQPYINICYNCVSTWPHHIFLHQMYANAIRTISIQANSLISFHEQSSVLLHQGTTFKELLSLSVYYRTDLCAKFHMQTYPQYRHLVAKNSTM